MYTLLEVLGAAIAFGTSEVVVAKLKGYENIGSTAFAEEVLRFFEEAVGE